MRTELANVRARRTPAACICGDACTLTHGGAVARRRLGVVVEHVARAAARATRGWRVRSASSRHTQSLEKTAQKRPAVHFPMAEATPAPPLDTQGKKGVVDAVARQVARVGRRGADGTRTVTHAARARAACPASKRRGGEVEAAAPKMARRASVAAAATSRRWSRRASAAGMTPSLQRRRRTDARDLADYSSSHAHTPAVGRHRRTLAATGRGRRRRRRRRARRRRRTSRATPPARRTSASPGCASLEDVSKPSGAGVAQRRDAERRQQPPRTPPSTPSRSRSPASRPAIIAWTATVRRGGTHSARCCAARRRGRAARRS